MRLGVLVSEYPSVSHTFIRREIAALRRRGADVQTFSIRRAPQAVLAAELNRSEAENTWNVLPASLPFFASAHVRALLRSPARYLGLLWEALGHRNPGAAELIWSVFYFVEAIALADELERRRLDHLHNHLANGGAIVGMLAAKFVGIPWSLTLHGASDFGRQSGPLLPQKIAAARFTVCATHFGRAQALWVTPYEQWSKIFVSRCGVELDRLPRRSPLPETNRSLRLLSVSRLSAEKGVPGLADALLRVVTAGADVHLTIIGDGPDRAKIEQHFAERGQRDRCTFRGACTEAEVLEAFASADIFVMPSFMEGLPVVLMEAMAMQVPVVAPRLAGIPELVQSGENGLLYTPSCWDELADAVLRLVSDPVLRGKLAAAGRDTVERDFDIDRAIEPLWAAFTGERE